MKKIVKAFVIITRKGGLVGGGNPIFYAVLPREKIAKETADKWAKSSGSKFFVIPCEITYEK